MNREDLDDFFARAEDVLTDWYPGDDAMIARVPEADDPDKLAPAGDSYYSQPWQVDAEVAGQWVPIGFTTDRLFPNPASLTPIINAMNSFARSLARIQMDAVTGSQSLDELRESLLWIAANQRARRLPAVPITSFRGLRPSCVIMDETRESPADRVIRQRRERNTGPRSRVGLDGHFRR